MSVKIRLMRMGKKKQPTYRVVVADGRSPRDGRYIEILGQYRPREEPSFFSVDDEKVLGWLRQGAQPTDQVHRLLVNAGIWERYETDRKTESRAVQTAEGAGQGCGGREGRPRRGGQGDCRGGGQGRRGRSAAEREGAAEAPARRGRGRGSRRPRSAATDEAAE